MRSRQPGRARRFAAFLLLVFLLPATAPVAATSATFRLHLDRVPAAQSLGIHADTPLDPPAGSDQRSNAETRDRASLLRSLGDDASARVDASSTRVDALAQAWLAAAPATASSALPGAQGSSDGGFGRWIKRHWYVAVIAAAAVALAVQDDSPDPEDPED